jgi:hypothetical protein
VGVFAQNTAEQTFGDFRYRIEESGVSRTVTITRYRGDKSDVVISAAINGMPVTSISKGRLAAKS